MVSSFTFPYHGGVYRGNIKFVKMKPRRGKKKGRARQHKMVPHGRGTYAYNGMTFDGMFRDGFEDVGTLTWPDGSSFIGEFNGGFPEPKVLQSHHQNCILKRGIKTCNQIWLLSKLKLMNTNKTLTLRKKQQWRLPSLLIVAKHSCSEYLSLPQPNRELMLLSYTILFRLVTKYIRIRSAITEQFVLANRM